MSLDTLARELEDLVAEALPSFIALEKFERFATEEELHLFDEECSIHDSCRVIR
jgi:hypothetical protein